MSYGDGFASIIGIRYGKKKYNVFGDQKSYVGSFAMFVFTFITMVVALVYYGIDLTSYVILVLLGIAFIAAVVEGLTPKGLDNLSVPFVAAFLYWAVFIL
jgi:dolichol kinase